MHIPCALRIEKQTALWRCPQARASWTPTARTQHRFFVPLAAPWTPPTSTRPTGHRHGPLGRAHWRRALLPLLCHAVLYAMMELVKNVDGHEPLVMAPMLPKWFFSEIW